jgi:hypothetical protein
VGASFHPALRLGDRHSPAFLAVPEAPGGHPTGQRDKVRGHVLCKKPSGSGRDKRSALATWLTLVGKAAGPAMCKAPVPAGGGKGSSLTKIIF